jgi:uncharacterized repeat protein (TIGR03803 family)
LRHLSGRRISRRRSLSGLKQTDAPDGEYPQGRTDRGFEDGELYGTTFFGGACGYGTVYEISP